MPRKLKLVKCAFTAALTLMGLCSVTSLTLVVWSSHHVRALSDVARFVLLYIYGGFYIDADVLLLRDFRPLQHFEWCGRRLSLTCHRRPQRAWRRAVAQ